MLGQRRRRWANIETTLVQLFVFARIAIITFSRETLELETVMDWDSHLFLDMCFHRHQVDKDDGSKYTLSYSRLFSTKTPQRNAYNDHINRLVIISIYLRKL